MAYTAQPAYMWYTYSSINTRRSIFNDNQIHSAQVPQSDIWCLFHHSHFCLPYDPFIVVQMFAIPPPCRKSEQHLVTKSTSIEKNASKKVVHFLKFSRHSKQGKKCILSRGRPISALLYKSGLLRRHRFSIREPAALIVMKPSIIVNWKRKSPNRTSHINIQCLPVQNGGLFEKKWITHNVRRRKQGCYY